MNKKLKFGIPVVLIALIISFSFLPSIQSKKINGICLVAPSHKVDTSHIRPLKNVNASWIAVTPYAFSRPGIPNVSYNNKSQWRGETDEGTIETIIAAKKLGLKVMMKPHIWVMGQGWAGEYDLPNDDVWKKWELAYSKYILRFAHISDSLDVEMICIGTEYKNAVVKRPQYWKNLIKEIRTFYDGKITYAANWDNYKNVTFWNDLDYIGVDAYFPICKSKTPTVNELNENWSPIVKELKAFHFQENKPIIFTEFGYRSMDYNAAGHWEMDNKNTSPNMDAQVNSTLAIFNTFWKQDWFAGGFLWKWYPKHNQNGGLNDSHYTPQNKPTESVIRDWYKSN